MERVKHKHPKLMAEPSSSSTLTDLDFAFHLQMQEAMTESLLLNPLPTSPSPSPSHTVDYETLKLLHHLERERKDVELREAEMQRTTFDLKRRVHDHSFAHEIYQIPESVWRRDGDNIEKPFARVGEGSSSSSSSPVSGAVVDDELPFRLYFKGLYSNERVGDGYNVVSIAAIGAAVCDPYHNLILNVQKPLVGDWKSDWAQEDLVMKVEIKALIDGLTAALTLDIKRLDVFFDYHPLYQFLTNRWLITQPKIATMVDQVALLQRKFSSCRPFFVARKDVKFAFKLARDAIDSQITRCAESSRMKDVKETCRICLEDTGIEQMFAVDGCLHRFCLSCMKQHVEVKLLHGIVPGCPHEACNTKLNIHSSRKYLTPELIDMMHKRIEEASIPVTEKIYCPYPKCSFLMSKTEVLHYANSVSIGGERSGARKCIKCHGLFCINCKVPWHSGLTCHEYARYNPNANAEDAKLKSLATNSSWRQCIKCKHMIELAEGCYHITCRCGNEFCYTCGAEWRNKKATCRCPIWDEPNIVNDRRRRR